MEKACTSENQRQVAEIELIAFQAAGVHSQLWYSAMTCCYVKQELKQDL